MVQRKNCIFAKNINYLFINETDKREEYDFWY